MRIDPARYLFVRLFIRKNGYFRLENIGYEIDIPDKEAACKELCSFKPFIGSLAQSDRETTPVNNVIIIEDNSPLRSRSTQASTSALQIEDFPHTDDTQEDIDTVTLGQFAEDGTSLRERSDVDELCSMVTLEELKGIAKDLKVSPPKEQKKGKTTAWTRSTIIECLKKHTTSQSTLFSAAAAVSSKKSSIQKQSTLSLNFGANGQKRRQSDLLVHRRKCTF